MAIFRYGHATAPDWHAAADACLAQLGEGAGNLGFLYVTDHFALAFADILERFRMATGIANWVGSVGMGIVATGREYLDEPAMAVMIGDFEKNAFRVFHGVDRAEALTDNLLDCAGSPAHFAIVHADPGNAEVPALVQALAKRVESGFLVGGLTSSRHENLQVADTVTAGGISGVAFSNDVAVATRLTQGCSPLGTRHVITECHRNVIMTLDGRPALEVLQEDIREKMARDLPKLGGYLFVGLPISGSDTEDYLVRHLVGIDPDTKLIAIGDVPQQGKPLIFCRRDRASAEEDMRRMLDSIQQGLFARPRGGVYYSCLGRGANLFGSDSEELRMIENALGDVPIVGFFCNGEISHNRLYGYTGVLTLFV